MTADIFGKAFASEDHEASPSLGHVASESFACVPQIMHVFISSRLLAA